MRKCWACKSTDRPTFAQLTTLVAEVSAQRTPKLCMKLFHSSHVECTPVFITYLLYAVSRVKRCSSSFVSEDRLVHVLRKICFELF